MFQLQVSETDVTNGTIAVSWCLDHEMLNELAKHNVVDPQVIICVAPVNNYYPSKEYRKIVPLKDLMTYIEFRSVGKNRIWGLISYKSPKEARDFYLEKKNGDFKSSILNFDGDKYAAWLRVEDAEVSVKEEGFKDLSEPLTVMVPEGVFAPEPKEWEKIWVNHFFRSKVVDQCDFRRRRIFAYTVQPLIMLLSMLGRLCMTILSFGLLLKGFTLQYILHPLTYKLSDTTDMFEKGSWAVVHLPEDDIGILDPARDSFPKPGYFLRSFYRVPLMPLFLVPSIIGALFGCWALPITIMGLLLFASFIVSIMGFIANYSEVMGGVLTKVGGTFIKVGHLAGRKPNTKLWYFDREEMDLITCTDERKPLSFKALPARHKTIKLRFQDLKAKVCKPFSL